MTEEEALKQVITSLERTLSHIQDKLKSAHVLNGGFDLLMERVTGIEESQNKILTEVENVKKTIYDPDNGIYSRIKEGDENTIQRFYGLDKTINEIKIHHEVDEKASAELEEDVKLALENMKKDLEKVETLKPKVDEIDKWKTNMNKVLFAIALPILTTFGKVIYDFFALHVQLK